MKRQEMILEFIKAFSKENGYPSTVREMCEGVGLQSSSTVHQHLNQLEKKGFIQRDPTKPRAIKVIEVE